MPPHSYPERPVPAVAVLVERDGEILMVLRGTPPALKTWSLPGGKMRLGETILEAAEREVREETGVSVQAERVLTAVDALYEDGSGGILYHYLVVYVCASYQGGEPEARDDALDARWVPRAEFDSLVVEARTRQTIKKIFLNQRRPSSPSSRPESRACDPSV
ncbi:MAG: NUDIX domain-containing protein [Deltaproteobacteria bacterium]